MNDAALFDRTFVVTVASCVREKAYPTAPIIKAATVGLALPGHMVRGRAHKGDNQWARVALKSGVIGYIWAGFGEWQQEVK